jgi:DNA (cytosine-5)-methyltransferase 1
VLDLFSGCGGLSLGFAAAGYALCAAVEADPEAARSHGLNFHSGAPEHSGHRDIVSTHPEELAAELGLGPAELAVDVIVGGPPCQAFARVGRPKLREIDAHPEAFRHDPRARLYLEYLRYVDAFQPLAVLMENVPDVLNHGGQNVAEDICEVLAAKGYVCGYTLLNAVHYGVPQMRERMFLVAYHREVAGAVRFPEATHRFVLPRGYHGTRAVAKKLLCGRSPAQGDLLAEASGRPHSYVEPPDAGGALLEAVTAGDALGDLPPIYAREQLAAGHLRRGARRFDAPVRYDGRRRVSAYAHTMRTWPGFEAPDGLTDHVIRYLPRDYEIFARMEPGDQYPQAYQRALDMLAERAAALRRKGVTAVPGSPEYEQLKKAIVPPYDPGKFPNKWRRLHRQEPVRTLMAHLGKDSYSHIHYDQAQARPISVREAARLQSFPDGFVFCGTMNPALRQIGNAVPPLLAKALAEKMKDALEAAALRHTGTPARRAAQALDRPRDAPADATPA